MSDASLNQDCICFEIAKKSAADFRVKVKDKKKSDRFAGLFGSRFIFLISNHIFR